MVLRPLRQPLNTSLDGMPISPRCPEALGKRPLSPSDDPAVSKRMRPQAGPPSPALVAMWLALHTRLAVTTWRRRTEAHELQLRAKAAADGIYRPHHLRRLTGRDALEDWASIVLDLQLKGCVCVQNLFSRGAVDAITAVPQPAERLEQQLARPSLKEYLVKEMRIPREHLPEAISALRTLHKPGGNAVVGGEFAAGNFAQVAYVDSVGQSLLPSLQVILEYGLHSILLGPRNELFDRVVRVLNEHLVLIKLAESETFVPKGRGKTRMGIHSDMSLQRLIDHCAMLEALMRLMPEVEVQTPLVPGSNLQAKMNRKAEGALSDPYRGAHFLNMAPHDIPLFCLKAQAGDEVMISWAYLCQHAPHIPAWVANVISGDGSTAAAHRHLDTIDIRPDHAQMEAIGARLHTENVTEPLHNMFNLLYTSRCVGTLRDRVRAWRLRRVVSCGIRAVVRRVIDPEGKPAKTKDACEEVATATYTPAQVAVDMRLDRRAAPNSLTLPRHEATVVATAAKRQAVKGKGSVTSHWSKLNQWLTLRGMRWVEENMIHYTTGPDATVGSCILWIAKDPTSHNPAMWGQHGAAAPRSNELNEKIRSEVVNGCHVLPRGYFGDDPARLQQLVNRVYEWYSGSGSCHHPTAPANRYPGNHSNHPPKSGETALTHEQIMSCKRLRYAHPDSRPEGQCAYAHWQVTVNQHKDSKALQKEIDAMPRGDESRKRKLAECLAATPPCVKQFQELYTDDVRQFVRSGTLRNDLPEDVASAVRRCIEPFQFRLPAP